MKFGAGGTSQAQCVHVFDWSQSGTASHEPSAITSSGRQEGQSKPWWEAGVGNVAL